MYEIPLEGVHFDNDNHKVYWKLKEFLVNMPEWAWVEHFDTSEDGHGACQAWTNHYSGCGELDKHTAHASAQIKA